MFTPEAFARRNNEFTQICLEEKVPGVIVTQWQNHRQLLAVFKRNDIFRIMRRAGWEPHEIREFTGFPMRQLRRILNEKGNK